jgi:hypothetical protein
MSAVSHRVWIASSSGPRRRRLLRVLLAPKQLLGWAICFLVVNEYRNIPPVPPLSSNDKYDAIAPGMILPLDQNDLPTVTIFYHLYVPKEEAGDSIQRTPNSTQHGHVDQPGPALQIVRQQLRHLSQALAAIPGLPPLTLQFTSVGADVHESIQDICRQYPRQFQACHQLQHLDQGFEKHTLQALYQHCANSSNSNVEADRVIYVHSKGSYHSSKAQNRWRRHMTDAVASRDCIEHAHKQNCDLCGLLFVARPSHHFTGNMFNAKCSAIQKLLPPMEFEAKMETVASQARKWVQDGILEAKLFRLDEPWTSGTKRYAMEHWHGSHPSIQKICDVSNHPTNKYWKSIRAEDRTPEDWQLAQFPRRPQPGLPVDVANNESKRKREYFLLAGQLMKWYQLYGEAPPMDSWVWSWYPDGPFWKEQVQAHGSKAVEIVATRQLGKL